MNYLLMVCCLHLLSCLPLHEGVVYLDSGIKYTLTELVKSFLLLCLGFLEIGLQSPFVEYRLGQGCCEICEE